MLAGMQRLQDQGVHRFKTADDFQKVNLSDKQLKADSQIVLDLLKITPWNLSQNFSKVFKEQKTIKLAVSNLRAEDAQWYGDSSFFSFQRRIAVSNLLEVSEIFVFFDCFILFDLSLFFLFSFSFPLFLTKNV